MQVEVKLKENAYKVYIDDGNPIKLMPRLSSI